MICIDASIFGHVIAPDESRVAAEEIKESGRLVAGILAGRTAACSPTMVIAEVKYLTGRIAKGDGAADFMERADEVEDLLPLTLGRGFRFIDVDFAIAALAADYRLEYYSKKNPFSYNDGIYLATASIMSCDALITTDPHLLAVSDVPVFTPSAYIKKKDM